MYTVTPDVGHPDFVSVGDFIKDVHRFNSSFCKTYIDLANIDNFHSAFSW